MTLAAQAEKIVVPHRQIDNKRLAAMMMMMLMVIGGQN